MPTVPLTATLLQRDSFMEKMASMADAIIAGARPRKSEVYAKAAQRWAEAMFASPLHSKNLKFMYELGVHHPIISRGQSHASP